MLSVAGDPSSAPRLAAYVIAQCFVCVVVNLNVVMLLRRELSNDSFIQSHECTSAKLPISRSLISSPPRPEKRLDKGEINAQSTAYQKPTSLCRGGGRSSVELPMTVSQCAVSGSDPQLWNLEEATATSHRSFDFRDRHLGATATDDNNEIIRDLIVLKTQDEYDRSPGMRFLELSETVLEVIE